MNKQDNKFVMWMVGLLILAFILAPAAAFLEPDGNPNVTKHPESGIRVYGEDDMGPAIYNCFNDPNGVCTVRGYTDYKDPFDPTILKKDSLTFNPAKIFYEDGYPISADSVNANEKKFLRVWYEPDHNYSKLKYHTRGLGEWRNVTGTIELESTYMLVDRQDELPLSGPANTTRFVLSIAEGPNQSGLSAIENAQGIPDMDNVVDLVGVGGTVSGILNKTTNGTIVVEKTYDLAPGETVQFFDHKVQLVGIIRDSAGIYWGKVKVSYAGNKDDDAIRTAVLGKFDDGTIGLNPHANTYFKRHNERYSAPSHPDTTFYARFNDYFVWEQKAQITVGKVLTTGDLFYVDAVRYEVRAVEVIDTDGNTIGDHFKYITLGSPLPKCENNMIVPDDGKISSQWIDCIEPGERIPLDWPFNVGQISMCGESMNILEVTEDKIFETLGKGKDPNYKPKDKASLKKNVEPFDYRHLLE